MSTITILYNIICIYPNFKTLGRTQTQCFVYILYSDACIICKYMCTTSKVKHSLHANDMHFLNPKRQLMRNVLHTELILCHVQLMLEIRNPCHKDSVNVRVCVCVFFFFFFH